MSVALFRMAPVIPCGLKSYFFGLTLYGIGGPPVLYPITIRPIAQLAH